MSQISALATQIAAVNRRIAESGSAPPSDLLDSRDRMIGELATRIAVQVVPQSDGTVNVLVGTGQSIVTGTQAFTLTTGGSLYDPSRPEVYHTGASGSGAVTEQLTGGELGGLLDFRRQVLDPARASIGRVVTSAAMDGNAQHRLGLDAYGQLGGDLWGDLSAAPQVFVGGTNTGDGVVQATITDLAGLTDSRYRVTGVGAGLPAVGVVYAPAVGATLAYNGWSVRLDGKPAAGDVFTVAPNTGGSGDGRNAEALAGEESKQVLEGGRASALDSYAGLVARVGSAGQQASTGAIARQALVDQATSAREAVSGVNLDEEAANMVQLQQAYQAAAQIIAISDALFASLLNAVAN